MAQPFTPQIVVPALFSSANLADFPRVTGSVPAAAIAVLDASIWINPPTDPFVIANWRNVITDYQQAGLTVLGYVPTDNGASANSQPTRDGSPKDPARAVADIAAYVDRWYTIFAPAQPNGIFFDEGPYPSRFTGCTPATETTPATLCGDVKDYYAAIYAHVKSKPPGPNTVMLNAAGYTEADNWVMTRPGADIAQLQETPATKYLVTGAGGFPASPPAWWTDPQYAPERIAHVVWGCVTVADMCRVVALAEQRRPATSTRSTAPKCLRQAPGLLARRARDRRSAGRQRRICARLD